MLRLAASFVVLAAILPLAIADGPTDNQPDKVRPVPPPGIEVPEADRTELAVGVAQLGKEIESLRDVLKSKPDLLDLVADVQIFYIAVRYALEYNEFFDANEIPVAKRLLKQGLDRAKSLNGQVPFAPWRNAPGSAVRAWAVNPLAARFNARRSEDRDLALVDRAIANGLIVRGYISKIDGSVQPYGLVVPASYLPGSPQRHRLDIWCHGRGEKLSELNFIDGRQKSPGEFTPRDAFVLHLYGRYCNANKFAGEIDCFEALDHVRRHYPIDDDRIVMRGFSMGGAAAWQFAVHYPDRWVAAAPGAGFSETPDFLKVFQSETLEPTPTEKTLWHLYDCTDYAVNLFNCPTVAYSGEIDKQKQAADMMATAMKAEGIELAHIIGPGTAHSYHPAAKAEINRRIDAIAERGRNPIPPRVRFTTWTLRYNRSFWVVLDGLEQHWQRARVDADIRDAGMVAVRTENVSALTLEMPSGLCPLDSTRRPRVLIDEQMIEAPPVLSDRSWTAHFHKRDGRWTVADVAGDGLARMRKRPGLQGPIDDAFMDSFLMVRPTGRANHPKVAAWADAEMKHAITQWRSQFRGEARVKDDTDVNDADIAAHNLVLWGDPGSNAILAKIANRLPIGWDAKSLSVGSDRYSAESHAPAVICPNPLNPKKYVVLNSGFTFREYDYLNNARQVPKLPDWAVIDITTPPSSRWPGKIVAAGFFDEAWELKQAVAASN